MRSPWCTNPFPARKMDALQRPTQPARRRGTLGRPRVHRDCQEATNLPWCWARRSGSIHAGATPHEVGHPAAQGRHRAREPGNAPPGRQFVLVRHATLPIDARSSPPTWGRTPRHGIAANPAITPPPKADRHRDCEPGEECCTDACATCRRLGRNSPPNSDAPGNWRRSSHLTIRRATRWAPA